MELDDLLGFDNDDPDEAAIQDLIEADDDFLDALIEQRRASHLTQKQVADRLGVSQSAIAHLEASGRDPHLSTLRRYAFAVGATYRHDVKPACAPPSDSLWDRVPLEDPYGWTPADNDTLSDALRA